MTHVTEEMKAAALDELNGMVFSDGAGAVCSWVNRHQNTLKALLAPAQRVGDDVPHDVLAVAKYMRQRLAAKDEDNFNKPLSFFDCVPREYFQTIADFVKKCRTARPAPDSVTDDFTMHSAKVILIPLLEGLLDGSTDVYEPIKILPNSLKGCLDFIKAATTPKNEPEVLTVEQFANSIAVRNDWSIGSQYWSVVRKAALYLSKKPNGVKIVEGK